ncbi:ABC transporter permease [Deinococcus sonorensis]|uniref:ABC transporter permease n=2 Tax=Deinococcus sonorensis TaxID=309891 RepID=A0AAU7UC20_9DEIO
MTATHPRPSPIAARLSLAFAVVAVIGLFVFPYGTFTRDSFSAAATIQRFPAGVLDYTGFAPRTLPAMTPALVAGWVALVALLLSIYAAARRQWWLWTAGLVALVATVAAMLLFEGALGREVQAQLAQGLRLRRIPFATGGPSMAMFFLLLGGLGVTLAGLSQYTSWWNRLNRLRGLLVPLVAIGLAIVVGALVVLIVQPIPIPQGTTIALTALSGFIGKADVVWFVYSTLFAPLTNLGDFFDSLKLATPLIFTGLAVAFAFRSGLFNIGAPGQLTAGAVAAMFAGVYLPLPGPLLLVASVVAAALGGALWGAIPGLLKARFGSSEVINTIMLNYIASAIFIFLLGNNTYQFFGHTVNLPFKAPGSNPSSLELQPGARLSPISQVLGLTDIGADTLTLGPIFAVAGFLAAFYGLRRNRWRVPIAVAAAVVLGALTWRLGIPVQVNGNLAASKLNTSFLLALLALIGFSVLMWRTATGFALRAVGLAPKAAEYGGISVARNTILAMTLAGAFAGLAGTHYVMGGALDEYRLKQNIPVNVGFDGITVALMGQSTPVGVLVSSVLFGTLDTGGLYVDQKLDGVNKDIVNVLKALIVLFIAAGGFLSRRVTDPPPPALVQAVDAGLNIDKAAVAVETTTPAKAGLPSLGQSSVDLGRAATDHTPGPEDPDEPRVDASKRGGR